ncbi:MAG: permease-like cell division protein FtsX [Rikenellaceae bacterium]
MAKYNPKKIRNAYAKSTFSVTLVLFLIGFISFLLFNIYKAASIVVDNTSISIMLKEDITKVQRDSIESFLNNTPGVSEIIYISKEDALKEFQTFTGEDISKFIDENPLPASYTVKLGVMDNKFITDTLQYNVAETIAADINKKDGVSEVLYQKELLSRIVRNVNILYAISAIFFIVLIIISIMLIYNTINMAVYSKRFLIKTMCMAGATNGFVRRPFIGLAIKQAFTASFITCIMLTAVIYFFYNFNIISIEKEDIKTISYLFLGLLVVSLSSCIILTSISVNKNMNLSSRKLHSY